jgi:hypothetical protein
MDFDLNNQAENLCAIITLLKSIMCHPCIDQSYKGLSTAIEPSCSDWLMKPCTANPSNILNLHHFLCFLSVEGRLQGFGTLNPNPLWIDSRAF